MKLPSLSSFFSSAAKGAGEGLLNGAKNIIASFVTDPTEKMKANAELAKLEITHEEEMAKIALEGDRLELEREKAYIEDTANARSANVQIQESDKASWLSKNVAYIIDLFLTAMWGMITIILFLKIFKVAAKDVDMVSLMALHGTATAVFMTVLNFHRGTSRSSEDKQKTMNKMMSK